MNEVEVREPLAGKGKALYNGKMHRSFAALTDDNGLVGRGYFWHFGQ